MTDSITLEKLDRRGREIVFTQARSANTFADTPVSDDELADIWELTRWTPTSANAQPARVLFIRTAEGKERLLRHMAEGNRAKTASAPVVAVVAYDTHWHDQLPTVFPIHPEVRDLYITDVASREKVGRFSAGLQAGAFLLATRAAGLAAGPMGGFDTTGVDAEFFTGTTWSALMVVAIGHPGTDPWFDRLPRIDTRDAVTWA